jgi:hypothetical protein
VTPSLHVDYKNAASKQYHKLGKALRTETTINDTRDFGVAKGLSHLPGLRQIGFTANRRLLDVQRISHDPAEGAAALTALTSPVISPAGTRTAGMPITSPRIQALLAAICAFRLLPNGFTNRDLRTHLAPLLGAGQTRSLSNWSVTRNGLRSPNLTHPDRPRAVKPSSGARPRRALALAVRVWRVISGKARGSLVPPSRWLGTTSASDGGHGGHRARE